MVDILFAACGVCDQVDFVLSTDLRRHDVAFLLTVRPTNRIGTRYNPNEPFIPQVGLMYVRGCEIDGMLDDAGKVIEEGWINSACRDQLLF